MTKAERNAKYIKTAIKQHSCTICGDSIGKGDKYYRYSYPIMRGCSPEKLPDDVWCHACCVRRQMLESAA